MSRGFAATTGELGDRQAAARALVGQRVLQVVYVDIDYRGWDLGYHDQSSRRTITAAAEWNEPTWDAKTFYYRNHGVELTTDLGEMWAITWDTPGARGESIRLQPQPVSAAGALWDVSTLEPWASLVRSPVSDVVLRYHPWSDDPPEFWCSRVSIHFGETSVELLLGDRDQEGQLSPSADNIAALWDAESLPQWERTDDLV